MWWLYPFAALAGLLNAVQSGTNAHLSKQLGQPVAAALVVVAVSATTLLAAGLVSGHLAWPGLDRVRDVPWWGWIGGACGAVIVLSQLFVAPAVGAGAYLGLTVTAAVLTSLALDHFALLGFQEHPAGLGRLVGAALMVAGVALVAKF